MTKLMLSVCTLKIMTFHKHSKEINNTELFKLRLGKKWVGCFTHWLINYFWVLYHQGTLCIDHHLKLRKTIDYYLELFISVHSVLNHVLRLKPWSLVESYLKSSQFIHNCSHIWPQSVNNFEWLSSTVIDDTCLVLDIAKLN